MRSTLCRKSTWCVTRIMVFPLRDPLTHSCIKLLEFKTWLYYKNTYNTVNIASFSVYCLKNIWIGANFNTTKVNN